MLPVHHVDAALAPALPDPLETLPSQLNFSPILKLRIAYVNITRSLRRWLAGRCLLPDEGTS